MIWRASGKHENQDLPLTWACKAFSMTAEQLGFTEWPDQTEKAESQETNAVFLSDQDMQSEKSSTVIRLTREQAEWIADLLGLGNNAMTPFHLSRRAALITILKQAGIAVATTQLLEAELWERLETLAEQGWQFIPEIAGVVSRNTLNYVLEHLKTVTELLEVPHPMPVYRQLCDTAAQLALISGVILAAMKKYSS